MKKIIFTIFLICFIYGISSCFYGLINPDEPRYAATAKNMVETGNYIVPYFNNHLRINKPPLTYWLIALSYKIFGINEFSARLPQIFSSILLIALGLFFSRKYLNYKEKIIFILTAASSPIFFYLARYCNTDMIVSLFFTLSLLLFYNYYETEKKIYGFLFFMSFLLTNLAKGPVAVLILLIISFFLITEKKFKRFLNLKNILLIIFFLLTPLIYLSIVSFFDNSVNIYSLVIRETSGRFLKGYRHPEAFYFYFQYIPLIFFPWIIFLILKVKKIKKFCYENNFNKLNILWFLTVLIFFSLSKSKLLSYILPLSFPFAYICGKLLSEFDFDIKNRYIFYFWGIFFISLLMFLLYLGYKIPNSNVLLIYLLLLVFMIFYCLINNNGIIKIALTNMFILLTIFTIGIDFINQNKTDKFLKKFRNIIKNGKIISFRSNNTGIAFYLGNYKQVDKIKSVNENNFIVVKRTDFNRYFNTCKDCEILAETKKKLILRLKQKND